MLGEIGERLAVVYTYIVEHYLRRVANLVDENREFRFAPEKQDALASTCRDAEPARIAVALDLRNSLGGWDVCIVAGNRGPHIIETADAEENAPAKHVCGQHFAAALVRLFRLRVWLRFHLV